MHIKLSGIGLNRKWCLLLTLLAMLIMLDVIGVNLLPAQVVASNSVGDMHCGVIGYC